jgi:uncharacterized protein YceK
MKPAIGKARMKVTVSTSHISWNLLFGLWVLLSLGGSGCSFINSRSNGDYYPGVYPGVRYNTIEYRWGRTDLPLLREGENPARGVRDDLPILPCGLLDFVFTLPLDTVMLPWDLPYWAFHKPSTNANSR